MNLKKALPIIANQYIMDGRARENLEAADSSAETTERVRK